MSEQDYKSLLSEACLRAVVASAACSFANPTPDREFVDLRVAMPKFRARFASRLGSSTPVVNPPQIYVQLKATEVPECTPSGDYVYRMNHEAYDELRAYSSPTYLAYFVCPPEAAHWTLHFGGMTVIQHNLYWARLDQLESSSLAQPAVVVPRSNVLTASWLEGTLASIGLTGDVA